MPGKQNAGKTLSHHRYRTHATILETQHSLLFEHAGFIDVKVGAFTNTYALRYWTRLAPIPSRPKRLMARMMASVGMDRIKCGFNVGNTITSGFKTG